MMLWLNAGIASLCVVAALSCNSFPIGFAYMGFAMGYVGLALFYSGMYQ